MAKWGALPVLLPANVALFSLNTELKIPPIGGSEPRLTSQHRLLTCLWLLRSHLLCRKLDQPAGRHFQQAPQELDMGLSVPGPKLMYGQSLQPPSTVAVLALTEPAIPGQAPSGTGSLLPPERHMLPDPQRLPGTHMG